MKKYINFNYKYQTSLEERANKIKVAGFDGVFVESKHNPKNYIETIFDAGLCIETLHLPYKKYSNGILIDSRYVNVIWRGGTDADEYSQELHREIDFAHEYGIPAVIMHITGGETPPPMNETALKFIRKMADHCEKNGIVLCLENLRRLDYLQYVFEELHDDKIKFCFDSGHANAMTHNVDTFPWDVYGKHLSCLHLNDNDGAHDQHLPPLLGNIRWQPLIRKILYYNPKINFTLEVRCSEEQQNTMSEEAYLNLCFSKLCDLEKMKENNNDA